MSGSEKKTRSEREYVRERVTKTLFTWSGGLRSSGVGFFCFVSPRENKRNQPKIPGSPTPCKQALRRFWKFHVVVVQNNGKEMYRKIVLHLQSCIFANYTNCCFFTVLRRCLRRLALHHFIFGLNYKYYRALRF